MKYLRWFLIMLVLLAAVGVLQFFHHPLIWNYILLGAAVFCGGLGCYRKLKN